MVNVSMHSIFNKDRQDEIIDDPILYTLPFSEQSVLQLQEIFVNFGVHIIKTKDIAQGRQIIQTILQSLNYYHNIACVTNTPGLATDICDVINHIHLEKKGTGNFIINLEDFFAINPCFDFIWVELTEEIKSKCTIQDMKKIFDLYHVDERMPVIMVAYER